MGARTLVFWLDMIEVYVGLPTRSVWWEKHRPLRFSDSAVSPLNPQNPHVQQHPAALQKAPLPKIKIDKLWKFATCELNNDSFSVTVWDYKHGNHASHFFCGEDGLPPTTSALPRCCTKRQPPREMSTKRPAYASWTSPNSYVWWPMELKYKYHTTPIASI